MIIEYSNRRVNDNAISQWPRLRICTRCHMSHQELPSCLYAPASVSFGSRNSPKAPPTTGLHLLQPGFTDWRYFLFQPLCWWGQKYCRPIQILLINRVYFIQTGRNLGCFVTSSSSTLDPQRPMGLQKQHKHRQHEQHRLMSRVTTSKYILNECNLYWEQL